MYEETSASTFRSTGTLNLQCLGWAGEGKAVISLGQVALQKSPSEMGEKDRGCSSGLPLLKCWGPRQTGTVTLGQWWRQTWQANQARKLASGSTSFCGSTFTTRWPSFGLEI